MLTGNTLKFLLALIVLAPIQGPWSACSIAASANEHANINEEQGSNTKVALPEPAPSPETYFLDTGDHLNIRFYDRYDRDDLNGEYAIGESGQFRLPRIGVFQARNRTPAQLEQDVRGAVENRGEKLGFFSIDVSRCRPFYVVGPVNRPGAYAFVPGLTVLHAVSLAGGMQRPSSTILLAEAIREKRTLTETMTRISGLLARKARLEAERANSQTVPIPMELVRLDPLRAPEIVAGEQRILKSTREVADRERSSLQHLIALDQREADNYKGELLRLGQRLEDQKRLFNGLQKLHEERIINQARILEAVVALDGLERDKQTASNGLSATNMALERAQRDLAMHELTERARIAKDISEVDLELNRLKQIAAQTRELAYGLDAIAGPGSSAQLTSYKIMRRDEAGRLGPIQASQTTPIKPGDIIQIEVHGAWDPDFTD